MIQTIVITILATWFIIALVTIIQDDTWFAALPLTLIMGVWNFITLPIRLCINKPKSAELYAMLKECGFYKKRLGKNFHVVTFYAEAGNKSAPLYKRILSYVPIIVYFKVIDEEEWNENEYQDKNETKEKVERFETAAQKQKQSMEKYKPDEWERNTFH